MAAQPSPGVKTRTKKATDGSRGGSSGDGGSGSDSLINSNLNSSAHYLDSGSGSSGGDVDGVGGSGKDLSQLTSRWDDHKQYLQLMPAMLSDVEDEDYEGASSPSSPGFGEGEGAMKADPLPTDPAEREAQLEEWREELAKIEQEIAMLRNVLGSKVRRANDLKRNLGITPFQEFKHDLQSGLSTIKESNTYQKTSETIHDWNEKISHTSAYQKTSAVMKTAGEKTSSAFNVMGAAVSRKLGDLKNSQAFKSMEEKVSSSYASVKSKVTGSKSTDDIDAAVQEVKEQDAGSPPTTPDDGTIPPTEKVPL